MSLSSRLFERAQNIKHKFRERMATVRARQMKSRLQAPLPDIGATVLHAIEGLEPRLLLSTTLPALSDDPAISHSSRANYVVAPGEILAITSATDGVSANDAFEGEASLSVAIQPKHGDLTLNQDGTFTFTADDDFVGVDGFIYKVQESGSSLFNLATATIHIEHDAPFAGNDDFSTQHDVPLTVPAGQLEPDLGTGHTFHLDQDAGHGTVVLDPDGGFTYTPDANWAGEDSFTYYVDDGILASDPATVTINVLNQAPRADHDWYTYDFNTYDNNSDRKLHAPASGYGSLRYSYDDNLGDWDPDGDSFTYELVDQPQHGTVVLNPDGSFTYEVEEQSPGVPYCLVKT